MNQSSRNSRRGFSKGNNIQPREKCKKKGKFVKNHRRSRIELRAVACQSPEEFGALRALARVQRDNRLLHEAGLSSEVTKISRKFAEKHISDKMRSDAGFREEMHGDFYCRLDEV